MLLNPLRSYGRNLILNYISQHITELNFSQGVMQRLKTLVKIIVHAVLRRYTSKCWGGSVQVYDGIKNSPPAIQQVDIYIGDYMFCVKKNRKLPG